MNLIESLQKTQTQRAEQPVPGQAAKLRKMLAAKSGKAGAVSGPAQSNIQEQQALVGFNQQATAQQQAAQSDVAGQQLAQQAQQTQTAQAQQQLDSQRAKQNQQFSQSNRQIVNNLVRLGKDIDSKEGRAALNEAIFARRLQDDKYVAELNRQGQVRRLEDRQDFAIEASKQAFENWEELFADEREFTEAMNKDMGEWKKSMARMGVDAARSILNSNMEAANTQAQWSAGGSFVTGLAQAANTEYTTTDAAGEPTKASLFDRYGSGDQFTSSTPMSTSSSTYQKGNA